jgi:hypothetical protein
MRAFEDIKISWADRDYIIKANRVMGAIARIEDIMTLNELQRFLARGAAPLGKVSMAYGTVLRYAGADVTDEQVYAGMFGAGDTSADSIIASVQALVAMMIPPPTQKIPGGGSIPRGNAVPAARASSKRHSKSRSATGK